jgi:hypothetical protein
MRIMTRLERTRDVFCAYHPWCQWQLLTLYNISSCCYVPGMIIRYAIRAEVPLGTIFWKSQSAFLCQCICSSSSYHLLKSACMNECPFRDSNSFLLDFYSLDFDPTFTAFHIRTYIHTTIHIYHSYGYVERISDGQNPGARDDVVLIRKSIANIKYNIIRRGFPQP